MGALRRPMGRDKGISGARRRAPVLCAAALAGAAALGVTACDPANGDMNTSAVALTADRAGTKELERQHLDVAWLSCTARHADRVTPKSGSSAGENAAVTVDCQGRSDDGKDITVKGTVRSVVDGGCVRGDLTAKVDGKQWFRVDVLGNCDAGDDNGDGGGDSEPPVSHQPPSHEKPRPGPTTTVTVTVTPPPDPTCDCRPGK
ncbi:hypothetical protein [Streptomyces sp. A1499]|uniref:hypothetical protein n=1 Tax=Streptomyces sp. A1499 TaxID=2563104 RepID=UPI001F1148E6|nr:hypothetical protein [Streptomyces sp. A1499]